MDTPRKLSAWVKILGIVVGVVSFLAASYLTQKSFDYLRGGSIDEKLVKACSDLNQSCPRMADSETRLDSTDMGPNRTWNYHYTLVHLHKGAIDPARLTELIRPKIVNGYRTDPKMKVFRESNVILAYHYSDADGNPITDIKVGPEDL